MLSLVLMCCTGERTRRPCTERVMELQFADDLVAVTTTRESMDRAASILQDLLGSYVECCEGQVAGCRKQG